MYCETYQNNTHTFYKGVHLSLQKGINLAVFRNVQLTLLSMKQLTISFAKLLMQLLIISFAKLSMKKLTIVFFWLICRWNSWQYNLPNYWWNSWNSWQYHLPNYHWNSWQCHCFFWPLKTSTCKWSISYHIKAIMCLSRSPHKWL